MTVFRTKRAYDPPEPGDGFRVLVDRLWPRGLGKASAAIDLWPHDATPSTDLRRWFHADRDARSSGFRQRYLAELDDSGAAATLAEELSSHDTVTLLTASADVASSHVPVLLEALVARG
ncbi:MAG: DUF488 family protein [Propionibacterium sp.]|nr:DUF488 family protein [Propionibacterium sp.]